MRIPDRLPGKRLRGALLLAVAVAVSAVSGREFLDQRKLLPIQRGPGVTSVRQLSNYLPALRGTRGDSEIFLLEGKKSGGTALVLGGTHPNEPAGHVAAVALVENVIMEAGRMFVIPYANASGFTATDPQEGNPPSFSLAGDAGIRWFRNGGRGTSTIDQWPDPDIYLHYPSGQTLSGSQTRNMNRAYPGRTDGNFTEKVAYAVTSLVRNEGVDLVMDLHEASPEYPVINTIVAHERAMPLAVNVAMNMELRGIRIGLEPSPKNLHGLTHRELGDHTPALAVLMETANPAEGRIRGRTSAELIVSGKDKMYLKAARAGRLFVDFNENGHPLDRERVARHLAGIEEFLKAFTEAYTQKPLIASHIPSSEAVAAEGIGRFLK